MLLDSGLLLPSLLVQADHEEPQEQRQFPEGSDSRDEGVQRGCQRRRQKQHPTQTVQRQQHADDARKEGWPGNEVAGWDQPESKKDQVDVKKQSFNNQLDIQLLTEKSNIEKYDALLKQDEQVLKLRKAIASASLAKLNNGVITSMDYLTDMNAEILAKLQFENHKILKKQAAVNFMLLQDKF